jgi:hypothetical protein
MYFKFITYNHNVVKETRDKMHYNKTLRLLRKNDCSCGKTISILLSDCVFRLNYSA